MIDIVAKDLEVTFRGGHQAVRDTSFRIEAGQFVSIVGPSGCGKSTLLRLVAGLIAPTGGGLIVAGLSPTENRRRRIGCRSSFKNPTSCPGAP
jgi:NitT/TauT family transport system ATP-binding protein